MTIHPDGHIHRYGTGYRPSDSAPQPPPPPARTPPQVPADQQSQVRGGSRTWDQVDAATERRAVLVARERAEAAAAERDACAQRVYAWAASLSKKHDRLVAAKAAEVVLDPTR